MKAHEYSFCPECGHKLEGDEFLCPSCGFKLAAQPPVAPPPVNEPAPPADEFVPPAAPVIPTPPAPEKPVVPVAETIVPPVVEQPVVPPTPVTPPVAAPVTPPVTPPQQQPLTFQPSPQEQYVPPKKKKKTALIIILVLLGVIVVGGGVGAFLIYNGTIPKDKVSFIPKEILEKLTPKQDVSAPVRVETKAYYITYAYTLIDNKKVVIISSVMDPSNSEKSNEKGAESAFLEFARINYSKDYFLFTKSMKTKKFDDRDKALQERENLKKDFKDKGYELRLMEVQYSIN